MSVRGRLCARSVLLDDLIVLNAWYLTLHRLAQQAGLDSLGAVELRNAVGSKFDIDLPATAVFDYPTASALADHIKARMVPSQVTIA